MFDRFTDRARQVVSLAQEEARLLRRDHVGTEHLLVAVAQLDDDVGAAVLHAHGLSGEAARGEVARIVGIGDAEVHGELPFTAPAREALDAALREALELGHPHIEPAHLLLAVLRQRDAVARRVLGSVGAHPPQLRAEIVERLGDARRDAPPEPGSPAVDGRLLLEILQRRGAVAAWLRERGVDEQAVRTMLGQ